MIYQVIATYDKKAKAYAMPFFTPQVELAFRAFEDAANDPIHQVGKHPEDFSLFHLGTYDDDNAHMHLHANPKHLVEAINLKRRDQLAERVVQEHLNDKGAS